MIRRTDSNHKEEQIPEYDLRPQMKASARENRKEKNETVSDSYVKKYDV